MGARPRVGSGQWDSQPSLGGSDQETGMCTTLSLPVKVAPGGPLEGTEGPLTRVTLKNVNARKEAHKLDSGPSTGTEELSIQRTGETLGANGRSGFEGAESTTAGEGSVGEGLQSRFLMQ